MSHEELMENVYRDWLNATSYLNGMETRWLETSQLNIEGHMRDSLNSKV